MEERRAASLGGEIRWTDGKGCILCRALRLGSKGLADLIRYVQRKGDLEDNMTHDNSPCEVRRNGHPHLWETRMPLVGLSLASNFVIVLVFMHVYDLSSLSNKSLW